jgi:hypothetical protein
MIKLVKTWLRRNRKGTYVYYLRGIGEDGTFHDLRSTCITEWLKKGLLPQFLACQVQGRYVCLLVDHAGRENTVSCYSH